MRGEAGGGEGEDGGKSTIAGRGDKLGARGNEYALRAFKPGVKPGFISDLFTPGKQLTNGAAIPRPVSSVYSKQSRRDSFYLTNDPGIANHSRKKQFIPAKWTHSMSFWFKAQRTSIVPIKLSAISYNPPWWMMGYNVKDAASM